MEKEIVMALAEELLIPCEVRQQMAVVMDKLPWDIMSPLSEQLTESNQAEEAWKLVIEKGKEIEAQAMQGEFEVPEDAMTGEQLLEALMKRADEKKKQNME